MSALLWGVILCKRPKVIGEPSHLWCDISSVGDMQLPVSWPAPASTRALVQKVLDFLWSSPWISWDLVRNQIYLQVMLVASGMNNMKSHIKNKNSQSFDLWNY